MSSALNSPNIDQEREQVQKNMKAFSSDISNTLKSILTLIKTGDFECVIPVLSAQDDTLPDTNTDMDISPENHLSESVDLSIIPKTEVMSDQIVTDEECKIRFREALNRLRDLECDLRYIKPELDARVDVTKRNLISMILDFKNVQDGRALAEDSEG